MSGERFHEPYYLVVRDHPILDSELERGAIPTPRLIEAGRGEAYYVPAEDPERSGVPGVWYLRAPGYEAPDGKYVRVKVIRNPRAY